MEINLELMSLNQVLGILGYETRPAKFYRKVIIRNGEPVGCFTAHECWEFLKQRHGSALIAVSPELVASIKGDFAAA